MKVKMMRIPPRVYFLIMNGTLLYTGSYPENDVDKHFHLTDKVNV